MSRTRLICGMIKADVKLLIAINELIQRRKKENLTMVVSVMDPKLLMKMLQVTLTGGPGRSSKYG